MRYFFLLGARDPEMLRIEFYLKLLIRRGLAIGYTWATHGGLPAHPGNAYAADPVAPCGFEKFVCVECSPTLLPEGCQVSSIDHHRDGDPGSHCGPRDYWLGSSIGQFCRSLGIHPTHDDRVLAAMDHCPAAAMRGECPGVDPEDVRSRMIAETLRTLRPAGICESVFRTAVARFELRLLQAPSVMIGGQDIKDLRDRPLEHGYSCEYLAAWHAVMDINGGRWHAALLNHRNDERWPEMVKITGHLEKPTLNVFKLWALDEGYENPYVRVVREYGGAYRVCVQV